MDELSETCRVSWQNKFVKLVHLVGFITKKFVTLHGHMNVKLLEEILSICSDHLTPSFFQRFVAEEKNISYAIVWKT
jgi:hypothetical protein